MTPMTHAKAMPVLTLICVFMEVSFLSRKFAKTVSASSVNARALSVFRADNLIRAVSSAVRLFLPLEMLPFSVHRLNRLLPRMMGPD